MSESQGARARRRERLNQQSKPQTVCSRRVGNNCIGNNCGLSNACHFRFPSRESNAGSGSQCSERVSVAGGIDACRPADVISRKVDACLRHLCSERPIISLKHRLFVSKIKPLGANIQNICRPLVCPNDVGPPSERNV